MSLLERTLSELAKPQWELAPGFGDAWDSCVHCAQNLDLPKGWREWSVNGLVFLKQAHAMVVDGKQASVLPFLEDDDVNDQQDFRLLQSAMEHITLPWPIVYIEFVGGARRNDYLSSAAPVNGALVGRGAAISNVAPGTPDDALWIITFTASDGHKGFMTSMVIQERSRPDAVPRTMSPTQFLPEDVVLRGMNSMRHTRGEPPLTPQGVMEHGAFEAYDAAERAMAVLQWLESANVEIIDAPVTRQVRRAAERRGSEIAKVVTVKLPRSWRNGKPPPSNGTRNFSHRFEVAAHYSFFPETTRMAQAAPEKVSFVPQRNGYFRRIWVPEHIKGPADKPLIPKTRKLVAA